MFDLRSAGAFLQGLSRRRKSYVFLAMDLAMVPLSLVLALGALPLPPGSPEAATILWIAVPYLLILAAAVFVSLGLPMRRLVDMDASLVGQTLTASALVTTGAVGLGMLSGNVPPLGVVLVFGMALFMGLTVSRVVLLQVVEAVYRRGRAVCRVLIYGAGTTGTQLVQAFRSHQDIDPVAFVDDNTALHGRSLAGLPVFPPVRISELVQARDIHRVLLAVPSLSPPRQARLARELQKMGLEVQRIPSFSQLIGTEGLIDRLETVPAGTFLDRAEVDGPLGNATDTYRAKSVMVTGAGGSIGSELCRQIIATRPQRLILFEMNEYALFNIEGELRPLAEEAGVEVVPVLGSVGDLERVRNVLIEREVQVVLHAAAYKHVHLVEQNPLAGLSNNVLGTQVLAAESVRAGVERFILVSSDKAVRPRGVMGASKRMAELVIQDLASRVEPGKGPVFSLVRFGNVLGSSGSVVPIFYEQIRRGGPVTVTDPEVTRYFMTIPEAARLVLRAGAMSEGGEVYLLEMGDPVRIYDLAVKAIEAQGYSVRDAMNPSGDIEIQFTQLAEGEKLHEELYLGGTRLRTDDEKIYRVDERALSELETADVLRSLRRAVEAGDRVAALDAIARRLASFRDARDARPHEPDADKPRYEDSGRTVPPRFN